MAKKNYTNMLAEEVNGFVRNNPEPSVKAVEKQIPEKVSEEHNKIETPLVPNGDDLKAYLDAQVEELLAAKLANKKVGRPKKYEEDLKGVSLKLELSVYETAKRISKMEFDSMSEYIIDCLRRDFKRRGV